MKHAEAFRQVMQAAFERAGTLRMQAGKKPLSLRKIAEETGIEVSVLSRLQRGISQPDNENLYRLLVYLGCDEIEQRWIFHLAELATPDETRQALVRAAMNLPIIQVPTAQEVQTTHVLDRLEAEVLSLQAPPDAPLSRKRRVQYKKQLGEEEKRNI